MKAIKVQIYPKKKQGETIAKTVGCCRFVYNWALATKTTEYQQTGKSPSCFELMRRLTQLKKQPETEWLALSPVHTLQKAITRLDTSFSAFFAKKGAYPRFKSRRDFKQSFQIPDKEQVATDFEKWQIKLPKLGWIKFHKDRLLKGEIRNATVSRTATGRHYISILVESGEATPEKKKYTEKNSVGIDVGIKDFAVLSNGTKIANPKFLNRQLKRLRVAQRSLQRKTGEKNREKQKLVVAKIHEKITNQRKDFLHKLSTAIAKQFVGVCVEDLNISGMLQNRKLSRAIAQCGWGVFKTFLKYKLDWCGGSLIEIGRFEPSSKMCSKCGWIKRDLTLDIRRWICQSCECEHDRDFNAATNIKLFGLRTQPFGANCLS